MSLGQRIRQHRTSQGLTLREVADAIGMSKTWVADLERGRHLPTDEGLLERLAFTLRDDWVALRELALEERAREHERLQAGQLRATPLSFSRIEAEAHRAAALLHPIENLEGEPLPILWDLTSAPETGKRLGLEAALRFATFRWEQEDDPEARTRLCDSALLVELREDVFERAMEGAGRDRFTAAHALGHAVLHAEVLRKAPPSSMFEERASSPAMTLALRAYESPEWQANTWASAYLVPNPAHLAYLQRQHAEEASVAQLARRFGVPLTVAQRRMEQAVIRWASAPPRPEVAP